MTIVKSPLTDSKDVTLLETIQAEQLILDWKKVLDIDVSGELSGHPEISLYQCNQTDLKFFLPVETAGSGKLYEQLQRFDWFYMPDKWEYEVALRDLRDCHAALEVGSALGDFIQAAMGQGLDVQGLELNEGAVRTAQSRNLPVLSVGLEEFSRSNPESQDAVCSFQVLEHVPNPKEFIEWCLRSLKPDGKLIFCVPNSESFLKHQYNLLDMPPHHMLRWSVSAFEALEQLFPMRLEKVIREPLASCHVCPYIHSYAHYFRSIHPWSRLMFNRFSLPVFERLLHLGLRRMAIGQSLYVVFRKLP
jgi:2-polyprenyl-3-methyl-5-hydroxy-6-metoxy-1,4-benzoquinol methylase